MNEIKSIVSEIMEDIKNEQPNNVSTTYKFGEVQIKLDGFNYSSYCVSKDEYELINQELNKLVLV